MNIEFTSEINNEEDQNIKLINKVFGNDAYKKYIRAVNRKKSIRVDRDFIKNILSEIDMENPLLEIDYKDSNKITHIMLIRVPEDTEARKLRYGAFGTNADFSGENVSLLIMSEDLLEKMDNNKYYLILGQYNQREYEGNLYHNMKVYDVVSLEELQ